MKNKLNEVRVNIDKKNENIITQKSIIGTFLTIT